MRTITVDEFKQELIAQGVQGHAQFAFKCPSCGVVQSAQDLILAGAGKDFDEVEKYVAFSCVGRWTGAGASRRPLDGKPCNWTLGGLFSIHELEVKTPDGKLHPRFEIATPAEAQAHAKELASNGQSSASPVDVKSTGSL